jgi:hypothetical protein
MVLSERRRIVLRRIRRSRIKVELSIIPRKLELKSIGPDKDRERSYETLLTEANFEEP